MLLAFEKGEGPWVRALGSESGAHVTGLGDGEKLCLEIEGQIGGKFLKAGISHIELKRNQMYRFTKTVPEGQRPLKTSVEVILNGSPNTSITDSGN